MQNLTAKTTRGLTSGEIKMAALVFKDSINYGIVKVHQGGLFGLPTAKNTAMTPNGEMFFPEQAYRDDFSIEGNKNKIWFIHELVHIWQYQLGYAVMWNAFILTIRGGYGSKATAYNYDLNGVDAGKTLPEFNMEQQAELISTYFDALFLDETGHPEQHAKAVQNLSKISEALGSFKTTPKDASLLPKTNSISTNQHR
ncbi:zinc protease [Iodobacter ciconiae]|uniref:Zinc protease n=1 Tax=Iodobacter ciconiae TaxID=2496266 RepID=A0A3S8ZVR8_9NEIS|nr:zinc protease [Iodobacter ciconiae]AZN37597.1 zinc protease [Iodobacter ciconiae]